MPGPLPQLTPNQGLYGTSQDQDTWTIAEELAAATHPRPMTLRPGSRPQLMATAPSKLSQYKTERKLYITGDLCCKCTLSMRLTMLHSFFRMFGSWLEIEMSLWVKGPETKFVGTCPRIWQEVISGHLSGFGSSVWETPTVWWICYGAEISSQPPTAFQLFRL